MRCAIAGFALGVAWIQTCGRLPDAFSLAITAVAACALLLAGRNAPCRLLAGAMLGLCWAALLAEASLAARLDPADEGRDLTLVGTIDSLPYKFDQGGRFNFLEERVENKDVAGPMPPRLSLSWYALFRDQAKPVEAVGEVQPGQRWRLNVRLQLPHGSAKPYAFDS